MNDVAHLPGSRETCRGMLHVPLYGLRFVQSKGGWAIYAGISKFLVAEGSGWSIPVGRELFRTLCKKQRYRS